MLLQHRRTLITGAASGIGAAIAQLFATQGSALMLSDYNASGLEAIVSHCRSLGATCYGVLADVGEPAGAQRGVDECIHLLGGIDILVNNAGMLTQARCSELTLVG